MCQDTVDNVSCAKQWFSTFFGIVHVPHERFKSQGKKSKISSIRSDFEPTCKLIQMFHPNLL